MLNDWENRIECYIKRGLDHWEPAHTKDIKQGDIFHYGDDKGYYEAYEDAYWSNGEWKVKAAWYKEGFVKTS